MGTIEEIKEWRECLEKKIDRNYKMDVVIVAMAVIGFIFNVIKAY